MLTSCSHAPGDLTPLPLQQLQVEREALQASNRRLAEHGLARRPRLHSGKLQLAGKYLELSNLATSCWEKQSQLGESDWGVRVETSGLE
ncbi:Vacuolar protein sorting-associated protein 37D [Liparis tanakae]|uniref:Vacuolar protein sorting-associated protein 37D n=1 Tax=Liparis tanakae TaxID=230148 RepID=A0A4Z2DZ14_9TELE|nr:Vacuolar protein sorting-associated protein 37D [Liparis tanakae]